MVVMSYSGQQRKYIGQMYDGSTGLNYLNARYQNPTQGQFISQDPVFLGNPSQQHISNPQSLNDYSYSEGNPITKSDPTGRDYLDTSGAFAFETPLGISVGPSVDYDYNLSGSNDDPYITAGATITLIPGPSGQVTYAPGNPSDGLSVSLNFLLQYVALQGTASVDSSGKAQGSLLPGAGGPRGEGLSTRSFSLTIGLTLRASQWNALFGPFQDETTVSTANNSGGIYFGGFASSNSNSIIRSQQQSGSTSQVGLFAGQDPSLTYTFNHGVNGYGQTYNQVFSH
jgi:RHS repeat-associated protein